MNTEKNLLQNIGKTILQEPIILEVDLPAKNRLHLYCQKKGWMPRKKELSIRPITLGNLVRISKILLEIEAKETTEHAIVVNHGPRAAEIIAIAVHNRRSEPPATLVRFIEEHFSSKDLLRAVAVVVTQMDLRSFIRTIISVKGMTVMSPKDQGR